MIYCRICNQKLFKPWEIIVKNGLTCILIWKNGLKWALILSKGSSFIIHNGNLQTARSSYTTTWILTEAITIQGKLFDIRYNNGLNRLKSKTNKEIKTMWCTSRRTPENYTWFWLTEKEKTSISYLNW